MAHINEYNVKCITNRITRMNESCVEPCYLATTGDLHIEQMKMLAVDKSILILWVGHSNNGCTVITGLPSGTWSGLKVMRCCWREDYGNLRISFPLKRSVTELIKSPLPSKRPDGAPRQKRAPVLVKCCCPAERRGETAEVAEEGFGSCGSSCCRT